MNPTPQPPDDTASISSAGQESPSEYSPKEVSAATKREFPLGKVTLLSPSSTKVCSLTQPTVPEQTDTFVKVRPLDIGFKKINDAGSKLARIASSHSNAIQHCTLSTIVAMTDMLENMDYHTDKYEETPYGLIAKQMSYLSSNDSVTEKIKSKKHDAHGISKYRKGAEKCTTTGRKKPKSCSFCQGDRRSFAEHSTMSTCGVKQSLGDCIKVTNDTKCKIGRKLMKIGAGSEGFTDVSAHPLFRNYTFIDSPPKGTKRMQIKAYCVKDGVRYLLCAMLNDRGWPITMVHGTKSVSYLNIFLSEISAVQCVGYCDYIFFMKVKISAYDCDVSRKRAKLEI